MKRIMFSVGEPSGELLAVEVIKRIKERIKGKVSFSGMGGEELRSHGLELIVDSTDLAVIGFVEVFKKWFTLKNSLQKMFAEINNNPPDILILVDYVEFNLRLGTFAKSKNIPVLFYVSPQIWAWGSKRISRINKATDAIASIFPFELDLYKSTDINVTYVGHPLTEIISSNFDFKHSRNSLKIRANQKVIGILPGSRESEFKKHLPVLRKTILKLNQLDKEIIFLVAILPKKSLKNLIAHWLMEFNTSGINIKVFFGRTYDVIAASNIVAVASGTATLETALIGSPMIVFYKTSQFSYFILKRLIKVKYISLVNILLKKKVVDEFIQENATPKKLTQALFRLLNSDDSREKQLLEFERIKELLGSKSASKSVAKLTLKMVTKP